LKRLQKWTGSKCELCQQLIPHWHEDRIYKPLHWHKPRRIFWGSTGDLFHPFTPENYINAVLQIVNRCPQHTHIFCTKNPARYRDFNPWPANCILLTTITNQKDADERIPELLRAQARVRGVSHKPLLGEIDLSRWIRPLICSQCGQKWEDRACGPTHALLANESASLLNWGIIGGMTGPGAVKPEPEWVQDLVNQYRAAGTSIFLKDNLRWPEKIQEWPD